MARSLFKPRKTSYFLMDLRTAISIGSSRGCFTALATYLAVPPLEISDGGIVGKGSFIQLQGWGPGWGYNSVLAPPLSLIGWLCLQAPGLLRPSQGLILQGGMSFSRLHHLFTFLIPFLVVVGEISSGGWWRWWGRKLCLGCLPTRLGL